MDVPQEKWNPTQKLLAEKTNAARIAHGLPPLELDEGLMKGADQWAFYMSERNFFEHDGGNFAENIAKGQRNIAEAIQSWLNSPGHRANMLNRRYTRLGVGIREDRNGVKYWVQRFK